MEFPGAMSDVCSSYGSSSDKMESAGKSFDSEHEEMILKSITDDLILELCFEMHYIVSYSTCFDFLLPVPVTFSPSFSVICPHSLCLAMLSSAAQYTSYQISPPPSPPPPSITLAV